MDVFRASIEQEGRKLIRERANEHSRELEWMQRVSVF